MDTSCFTIKVGRIADLIEKRGAPMNYIVFDMEWNQAFTNKRMVRTPVVLYGEIIQIGAVK